MNDETRPIDRGQVTVSACGGSLPRFRLRGEVGDDPSEVVRRFARENEVFYKCTENYVGPLCTTGWPGERTALVSQLGELLDAEGGPSDGEDAQAH